jgi:ATP-binding cassette subfamily B protein
VLSRLRDLFAGRTALFITHRLATARGADKVVVLRNGTVAETGTYEELLRHDGLFVELLRHDGLFAELHRLQEGEE